MTAALVIHGHFYQPPRENPWTNTVSREPSANPFHDWNERIHYECYRPNAYARIIDYYGRVEGVINNYANISFNFGPTLLAWLEQHHPETYARILEADRESAGKYGGHGNAIAQGYHHAILPLCNERDRRTEIRWGIADFRHRFKRNPESLWLPETACNDETLGALIDEGLKYVILSPYQAERVRNGKNGKWRSVADGSIDTSVPYQYFHRDGSGRSLAVFFYDGQIARAIAFEGALASSQGLVDYFQRAARGKGHIVNVATDGESYGHHFHFGDRTLAHTLEVEAPARGFWITNYGEYLDRYPPELEVEIKKGPNDEGTAWSCAHGVGRWRRDCGCHGGALEGWNQAWREPLREAFDFLRDEAARQYELIAGELFLDPWAARDAYIELLVDRKRSKEEFLHRQAGRRRLSETDQVRALTLLELQRSSLLTYTSCGWFFNDISGIETLQVIRYAGRVLDLLDELKLPSPRQPFLELLAEAQSNVKKLGNGADIYRHFVEKSRVTPARVAANLAITSLVDQSGQTGESAGYSFHLRDFQRLSHGRITLATGRIVLQATATGKQFAYALAALNFGEVDFYCALKPFPGEQAFTASAERLWRHFRTSSLPTMLRLAQEEFGPDEFGLEHLLAESRQRISEIIFGNIVDRFSEAYESLYEETRRNIEMLQEAGFELPAELRAAAEFTMGRRFEEEIRRQQRSQNPADYQRALAIANEVAQHGYQIDLSTASRIFEEMVTRTVSFAINHPADENIESALTLLALTKKLRLQINLERAQEIVYEALQHGSVRPDAVQQLAIELGLSPILLQHKAQAAMRDKMVAAEAETTLP